MEHNKEVKPIQWPEFKMDGTVYHAFTRWFEEFVIPANQMIDTKVKAYGYTTVDNDLIFSPKNMKDYSHTAYIVGIESVLKDDHKKCLQDIVDKLKDDTPHKFKDLLDRAQKLLDKEK